MGSHASDHPAPAILGEVKPTPLPRAVLVLNNRDFHWITEKICGIVEGKTPVWWWWCFGIAAFIASFTVADLGSRLRLPKVTGYIVAGIVLGPATGGERHDDLDRAARVVAGLRENALGCAGGSNSGEAEGVQVELTAGGHDRVSFC